MADLILNGSITLPMLTVASEVALVENTGDVDVTLPMLTVAIDVAGGGVINDANIAVTLPMLQVSASIGEPVGVEIAITLPMLKVYSVVQMAGEVIPYIGLARSGGTLIFAFIGPPNLSIEWSLLQGSGTLTPMGRSATDAVGKAFCRYAPGAYSGPAEIAVTYVA